MRMKKRSICKTKFKEIIKEEILPLANGLHECSLPIGRCFLSVEKRLKKGEFYSNNYFNAFVRRLTNSDVNKFSQMVEGFNFFKNQFKDRKSMFKALRKANIKRNKELGIFK